MPIFADSASKNLYFLTPQKYLHNQKLLNITIPAIRRKLQMFPHLNNSQKKWSVTRREVEVTINWKGFA